MDGIQQHNLDLALTLASQGLFIFPCRGCGDQPKVPCPGVGWLSMSSKDPRVINGWWQRWPDAVPAIGLGRNKLIAIDCDRKLSDGKAWLEAHYGNLDHVPGATTPGGGRHYIFRAFGKHGNSRGNLPPKTEADIDVRGDHGYIIAPGARFADGAGVYVSHGTLADAPAMPGGLVELLAGVPEPPLPPPMPRPDPRPRPPHPTPPPLQPQARMASGATYVPPEPITDYQREAFGRAALEGAAAELAAAQVGERNELANAKAYHIGRYVGGGYIGQGEAYSALEQAGLSLGLHPKDKLFGVKGTLWRAIQDGMKKPLDPLAGREGQGVTIDLLKGRERVVIDLKSGEPFKPEPDEPDEPSSPPPPSIADIVPGDWSQPEGLLKTMADWIMATSRWPNRQLAVAAATATLSAVCGRHLYGPTGTAVNLYIVMLAGTGIGKERPLSASHAMLRAAGLDDLAQTAKTFSVSAFEQMIVEHPCCCANIDEIGLTLLKRIFNRQAKAQESDIKGVLNVLWSRSQRAEPFPTTRRVKTDNGPATINVPVPALTILSASTLEIFYEVLTGGSIRDGFLNRLLLCHAGVEGEAQEVPNEAFDVPIGIVEELQMLIPKIPGSLAEGGGNMVDNLPGGVFNSKMPPQVLQAVEFRVPWANDDMKAEAGAFERQIRDLSKANSDEGPLLNRVFEYAVRLATLHAVSRVGIRTRAAVGPADWAWGKALALTSACRMVADANRYMSETEAQEIARAIKRVLQDKGGKVTRSAMLKALDYKYKARDLGEALGQMIEAGAVETEQIKTAGRPAKWYSWVGQPGGK